ncbi:indole-diterpene biosynthesis protein-like protein PaxU [Xylaria sp. FL0043]|nr:indole-diterpene biosynthesis protein-like protein PaxU [Xylaria sp. FL0043]
MARTRGYTHLGRDISLYAPREPKIGQLIILCPSLGIANTRLVCQYTALYQKHTPHAKILIIKPSILSMISPPSKQEEALKPAGDAVCDILNSCGRLGESDNESRRPHPRILLHIMGNGGLNSATNLLVVLEHRFKTSLPLVGIICDSAPGGASYRKACRALIYSHIHDLIFQFPSAPIFWALVHILFSVYYLFIALCRYEVRGEYWRESILNDRLVDCKRICYFASVADGVTDWRDVLSHAEQARRKGWEVREFLYEDTSHCRHMDHQKHRNDYENAVCYLWKSKSNSVN